MDYLVYYSIGFCYKIFSATPMRINGAKSAQHAINIVGARPFFRRVDRVMVTEHGAWIQCDNWKQPSMEARTANAIVEVTK